MEHYAPNYPDSEVVSFDLDSDLRNKLVKIRDCCQEINLKISGGCAAELLEPGLILAREVVRARFEALRRVIRLEMDAEQFFLHAIEAD